MGRSTHDAAGLVLPDDRHYHPSTGVFVSVDQLVARTMQPYIYGAANPITSSDPKGLCAGSKVFDTCILPDGKVVDQNTSRFRTPAEDDFAIVVTSGVVAGGGGGGSFMITNTEVWDRVCRAMR